MQREWGYGFDNDLTGSLRDHGIAYIMDASGYPEGGAFTSNSPTHAFSFKFCRMSSASSDTAYNWWVSNGNPTRDFGPRLGESPLRDFGTGGTGTPEGDKNKYHMLRIPVWDYDQIYVTEYEGVDPAYPASFATDLVDGFDVKFLMSTGPFEILPDSSIRVVFALFSAQNIHVDPNNANHFSDYPYIPDVYYNNLNLQALTEGGEYAAQLADIITHPSAPVTGITKIASGGDSARFWWDPWVFPEVTGYAVYLGEFPADTAVPHPGVIPPWYEPADFTRVTEVSEASLTLHSLEPHANYVIRVAHTYSGEEGLQDNGQRFKVVDRVAAPSVAADIFVLQDSTADLQWTYDGNVPVDHFNVYRFEDTTAFQARYHAFYDSGFAKSTLTPADSVFESGDWYYFYAMEPIAQLPSSDSSWTIGIPVDSTVYAVTAVDANGFESHFSNGAVIHVLTPPEGNILVMTSSESVGAGVLADSILSFYDEVLQGYQYDILDYTETVEKNWQATLPATASSNTLSKNIGW